ncbi:hypothetical protein GJ496_000563 [Pomphorhynchus laevis]|nr:hypothetical protein GJ496_000563 [Pomphorhynchus laevis]
MKERRIYIYSKNNDTINTKQQPSNHTNNNQDKNSNGQCTKCRRQSAKCYNSIKDNTMFSSLNTGLSYQLKRSTNCAPKGVVYVENCELCEAQYVDEWIIDERTPE